jgi:murein L,D-transpeptidase YcbB/YkuD
MVLASVLFASAAYADPVADALGARIDELQFGGDLHIGDARILMDQLLPSIYAERGFQPLWTDEGRIQELLEWLETAPAHGLDTADYHLADLKAQIAEARASRTPLAMADQDILLTEAFLLFGYHQVFGKVHPTGVDANINFERRFLTEGGPINGAPAVIASDKPLAHHIAEHLGRAPIYEQFQGLLAQHREIAASGGWPTVPAGETLRAGDDDPRVAALRRRLVASGDLPPGADTTSTHFNDPLATAVKSFQARHALGTDGVVGANTYAALNVPVETRIDQLRLTLERIRWVRAERKERFVVVNIAGFRVFFYERNGITWTARAMVGRAYRQTPIFRGRMQYMEINPTWTVPPGILRKDVLPAIKRDAGYLQAKNMSVIDRDGEVVDPTTVDWQAYSRGIPYSIRQEPGPKNALGEIKFIFPNEHFVFLHDTPSRNLFDRPERTFSSGCIRVDKPFELAQLLLNEPGKWSQETLGAVRDSRKTQRIRTPKGTSVLILYLTASIEEDGRARFLRDIYERDARLLDALNGPVRIDLPGV